VDEDRIALFLDYENLALGAKEHLGGAPFDLKPISDALAERGRVVARRAYADWSYFDDDRRMLTRSHVELIEMPQRMGASRKNAADIKMAVDAIELAFSRDYISTFAVCTGDSDFTPLVHKLRELNKRVIGFGVRDSTSRLLPPACDEFLFYDNLEGVEPAPATTRSSSDGGSSRGARRAKSAPRRSGGAAAPAADSSPSTPASETPMTTGGEEDEDTAPPPDLAVLVAQTVAGLQQSSAGPVTASTLKRTLLRKDPTFSEADHGFRAFGELLEKLQTRSIVELVPGPAKGDPEIRLPEVGDRAEAFALLRQVVAEAEAAEGPVSLSGLKDQLRRSQPGFSEKKQGYRSFLQFCKAAQADGVVALDWDQAGREYVLRAP